MASRLPPLTALRTFEAAARHLSFTRAADELAVTQAAVSFQIRQLEEHIGVSLFRRMTRRLELTPQGRELATAMTDALDRIRGAVERLQVTPDSGILSISALPTFAAQWLVPRMGQFNILHPGVAVRLDASSRLVDLERGEFDVAIRAGHGAWPGLVAERLMALELTPALAPGLLERAGSIERPADLLKLSFLDSQDPVDQTWWRQWFALSGTPVDRLPSGSQYDTQLITGHAACMGQGVALICPIFFAGDIAAGRLVLPFPDLVLETGVAYWLVYAERRREDPKIRSFRDWIRTEVSACAGQCATV
ncbi:transcriptional regulator GcvA [Indioceanicola profundi]|uniref:transcriptional regulator GcvA n=1 Tax=Indioceanicola profundi TaxID=2220096 RepID=UPI000E6ACB8B|nr:transcriptional regulator GcvA [Indioceanicola profundi]